MQGHGPEREPADWDDLLDPRDDDHDIEYWVWDGTHLVPATLQERLRIQEDERTQAAQRRLEQLQERERREARSAMRRLSTAKAWWRKPVSVAMRWLRNTWQPGQTRRTEGVRAERSSTKR